MGHVGDRIKQARIDKGMTQLELANLLGVSKGTISRYELCSREPRYSQLCAIADALHIPTQQLAGPFPDGDDSSSTDVATIKSSGELKSKKLEITLLALFDVLSVKGQAEAVRRLSELSQLPEYRRELTLPQALILYASQENKAGYYATEDVAEMEFVSQGGSFESKREEISVRHIVLCPVAEDSAPIQHFWVYLTPVADAETMDAISHQVISKNYNYKDSHLIVFPDESSCRFSYNYFEKTYSDANQEELPKLVFLLAQKNETGSWAIRECDKFGFPPI